MEFISQYGLFLLKLFTFVIAILFTVGGIFALSRKPKPKLEIVSLNNKYDSMKRKMLNETKSHEKLAKKTKKEKAQDKEKPSLFVLDFYGDIKATQTESLREAITAILSIAKDNDEVLVKIDSPGGVVNAYGLAASQLHRIRDKHIPLTVAIDKMAASGGYLMACVANKIIASPFAIIGSIGVVAQLPNLHRFLKKKDIDFELITSGEYKRTLTVFGENTEKGRQKFQEDIEKIHMAFRDYVLTNREQVDIDKVSTGEHWLAKEAHELKLVDNLQTSDDYLIEKMKTFNAFQIVIHGKQSLIDKLLKPAAKLLHPWA